MLERYKEIDILVHCWKVNLYKLSGGQFGNVYQQPCDPETPTLNLP